MLKTMHSNATPRGEPDPHCASVRRRSAADAADGGGEGGEEEMDVPRTEPATSCGRRCIHKCIPRRVHGEERGVAGARQEGPASLTAPATIHQPVRSFSTHLSSHVSCSSLVRYESTASVEPSEVEGHEADACESSATSCGADADSQSVLTPIVDSPVAAQLHWLQRREHSAGSALSTLDVAEGQICRWIQNAEARTQAFASSPQKCGCP
jgi:hypothetical protein